MEEPLVKVLPWPNFYFYFIEQLQLRSLNQQVATKTRTPIFKRAFLIKIQNRNTFTPSAPSLPLPGLRVTNKRHFENHQG